jgi:tetratricopeptide (TPR) repeat protein
VDAEQYAEATKILDKVKAMPKLSAYETAQLYSFYGFLYYNSEQYPRAITAYDTVLKQPDLPEALQQQTLKTLAQLKFVVEDYQGGIDYARQYMEIVGPDPDMYALIGTAYYQMDQVPKIIEPVEKAVALARERGTTVKEQWWLLLRVAYWDKDDFQKVKEILETLVVNWPKKEYWTQLSGIYFELKDEPRQLAAYEAAYDQGLLERSGELVQMAQLFMQAEVPYKGSRVMEKGFEEKKIERTVRNLRLYSQAWQLAQEYRKAIPPLNEAAGMSDDGDLYARLATSYLNLSEYKNCIDASRKAIDKGKLKYTGNTWLIFGMCQYESKQLASAKSSFRNAAKDKKSAKNARNWIAFVESEQSRLRQLEASLQRVREGS